MSQVSKYPVSKAVYNRIFDIFLQTLADLSNKKDVSSFIKDFLSPTEQVMMSKRLSIGFLLARKYSYRDISEILRVSTGTIRNVHLLYKNGDIFNKVINRLLKDEKLELFWLNIGEKLTKTLTVSKSKSETWLYLKQKIQKQKRSKVF